jgi:hypothetical protein
MQKLIEWVKREPVTAGAIFNAVLYLALSFGLPLTPEQQAGLFGLINVLFGAKIVRAKVTPV